jgi:hypothetical protein
MAKKRSPGAGTVRVEIVSEDEVAASQEPRAPMQGVVGRGRTGCCQILCGSYRGSGGGWGNESGAIA